MTIENSETFAWLGDTSAHALYYFYDNTIIVYYDDEEHSYTRYDEAGNLIYIPGVTTVCHIVDYGKSDGLTMWAANMTTFYLQDKIAAHRAEGKDWADITDELFNVWLNEARFHFRDYKNKAADLGKIAHGWIEDFIRALMRNDLEAVMRQVDNLPDDPRARNGCLAALNFMARHKVRWVFTERKLYSREHDFSGTTDGLCNASSCGDPECCGRYDMDTGQKVPVWFIDVLAIVDWKLANKLYREFEWQTSAYDKAILEELGIHAPLRFVTRLGKETAEFESKLLFEDSIEQDFRIFLRCLDLYKDLEAQKDSERALKDAVKAVLKQRKEEDKARAKAERKAARAERKQEREAAEALYKLLRSQGMSVKEAKAAAYGADKIGKE